MEQLAEKKELFQSGAALTGCRGLGVEEDQGLYGFDGIGGQHGLEAQLGDARREQSAQTLVAYGREVDVAGAGQGVANLGGPVAVNRGYVVEGGRRDAQ